MTQTALYFPAFIPGEQWLKDSLLYWDKIGSIVPAADAKFADVADLQYLRAEGLYEQIDPTEDVQHRLDGFGLTEEFIRKASDPAFQASVVMDSNDVMHMSLSKATHHMKRFLHEQGWVFDVQDWAFLVVPSSVGLLWVSLLAKYLAEGDHTRFLTPCTDLPSELFRVFGDNKETADALQLELAGLLPKANPSASLLSIVEFRADHRRQLVAHRSFLREKIQLLTSDKTWGEFKDIASRVQDDLELKQEEFKSLMGNLKDDSTSSTVSAIVGAGSPAVIGTLAGLAAVPVGGTSSLAAGALGGATISVLKFALGHRSRYRQLNAHPLAFLHSAREQGVLS